MNKFLKGLLLSFLIVTLSFNMLPLGAQDITMPDGSGVITPLYEVTASTLSSFKITGGKANTTSFYSAGSTFTNASVFTFIQKLENGAWKAASTTVTCAWNDTSTNRADGWTHTMQLPGSGSYRAKFVYYIYGTNNTSDRIEEFVYDNY